MPTVPLTIPADVAEAFEKEAILLRSFVLHSALVLEWGIAELIAHSLGIDRKESEVLGNNSKSIDFSVKMRFLIEMKMLNPKYKSKLLWFLSIRNQFMHNFEADSMEKCLAYAKIKPKDFLKQFPQPEGYAQEARLVAACLQLCDLTLVIVKETLEAYGFSLKEKITRHEQHLKMMELIGHLRWPEHFPLKENGSV